MTLEPGVIVDLDGVVYRGDVPIQGSPEAIDRLDRAGLRIVFVTNNSTRTVAQSCEKILRVGGYRADPDQVVTSANAAVSVIPEGSRTCMIVGGDGIREAASQAGLVEVEGPGEVDCVLVGLDRGFDYRALDLAARAIRDGAVFLATNQDPTFPSSDGLMPGAGSIVAAIRAASGVEPVVAGKPERPIRELIRSRGVGPAWVIGDRVDTDIALAVAEEDWTSILVMTGVTGAGDDTTSADFVVDDLSAAADLVLGGRDER